MGSAQYQPEQLDFPLDEFNEDARAALKQEVAERLAAHRSRRGKPGSAQPTPIAEPKRRTGRAAHIADAVKERYAQSQSYRDFLTAEAERAIEEANAAAQVAARSAQAITVAQQQLLAELDHWNDPVVEEAEASEAVPAWPSVAVSGPEPAAVQVLASGLTVRMYEDAGVNQPRPDVAYVSGGRMGLQSSMDEEEAFALDDEIAFRQTPVFEEPAGPTVPIPANLIEFPRQLVASRKARPRIAEGPLREEADAAPTSAQLRIFEVEATQIATVPEVQAASAVPEWSSIHLDATPAAARSEQLETTLVLPLEVAALDLRLMAAAVDGCILGSAFLAAVTGFAMRAAVLPSVPVAAIAAAVTLLVLFVIYHVLFFTFADATPGMRYARIGLCTFADENPTRSQMRRRIWAILLAACPLGIGFLWAWLDDDRLGWHDRISRMYQRSY